MNRFTAGYLCLYTGIDLHYIQNTFIDPGLGLQKRVAKIGWGHFSSLTSH